MNAWHCVSCYVLSYLLKNFTPVLHCRIDVDRCVHGCVPEARVLTHVRSSSSYGPLRQSHWCLRSMLVQSVRQHNPGAAGTSCIGHCYEESSVTAVVVRNNRLHLWPFTFWRALWTDIDRPRPVGLAASAMNRVLFSFERLDIDTAKPVSLLVCCWLLLADGLLTGGTDSAKA